MKPFTVVTGAAIPLPMSNVDTDVVIRVERMTNRSPAGLRKYAFEALRYRQDGAEIADCVFNMPVFKDAPILLAGGNFGCGSSREPAVWAIMALGIRCVIAESFGDIFFSNCFQNGVLPLTLSHQAVEQLMAEARSGNPAFFVDLERQKVTAPSGASFGFQVDPQRREALIEGLDEVGQTLKLMEDVSRWQEADKAARPWVWLPDAVQLDAAR